MHADTGRSYVIGITGAPGTGKSTLTDRLTTHYRQQGFSVGVLAVDPTSPFTGGAFLGDRIRMQKHYLDAGVFIRSMATRGTSGGLTRMTKSAVRIMDAAGFDVILLETVGVGQTEVEVMQVADSIVVVLVPEGGDAIQTLKAGLIEIADIFVINKADRDGASRLATSLEATLHLAAQQPAWRPPVLQTQANAGQGIDILEQTIARHREDLEKSSQLRERRGQRDRREFLKSIEEGLGDLLSTLEGQHSLTGTILASVEQGEKDPFVAAHEVLNNGVLLREWLHNIENPT